MLSTHHTDAVHTHQETYPEDALPPDALLADVAEPTGLGRASDVAQGADVDVRESNLHKILRGGRGWIQRDRGLERCSELSSITKLPHNSFLSRLAVKIRG